MMMQSLKNTYVGRINSRALIQVGVFSLSYVHRVGRTARAGKEGYAVTFVTDNDRSLLKAIVKRAGSTLKSRIVAEQSVSKWVQVIEKIEDQVAAIIQEERTEMALRKAEMEMTKAENMIIHRDEIYSRPERTWFQSEKEKKLIAKASKASSQGKRNESGNEVISAEQAEDLKKKEKRKRELEKSLPRKKRRKLEAAREQLEDEEDEDRKGGNQKEKGGISLVDLGYRRAKAVKAVKRAADSGKIVKNKAKPFSSQKKVKSRPEEMRELFESDMSDKKQKRITPRAGSKKKSAFKRKSRGYMASEYAMRGYLTDKADVYSFGVVMLEIVSGKSNTNYRPKEEFVYLLDWAYVLQEQGGHYSRVAALMLWKRF